MKQKKCKNCKGTGLIPLGEGIKGLKECPVCKGTGKIVSSRKIQLLRRNDMIKSTLGPRNEKKAKELIDEYNSLSVGDSLYTSTHLGRYLDSYFREHGLSYGDDFMCPPYREGEIVKLTDKKVVSSRQIKSSYLVTTIDDEIDRRMYWNGSDGCWYYATSQGTKYDNYSDAENAVYEAALELPSDSKYPVGIKEINSSRRNNSIKSSPNYHDYDHEYQDIHEEDIDDWLNVPKQEYRVGNKVILKAEGDSATRTVTEILDTSCELKVGDSVNDFSSNKDYLDDVYHGNFVITSTKSKENNMRNNVIKSEYKSQYEDWYEDPDYWKDLDEKLRVEYAEEKGIDLNETVIDEDDFNQWVIRRAAAYSSRRNNMKDDIVLSGLDRNKDSLNGVFNLSRRLVKSSYSLLDENDIFVQNMFPIMIDTDDMSVTKNAEKPEGLIHTDNAGWWKKYISKSSDSSGGAEYSEIYYFETPGEFNRYISNFQAEDGRDVKDGMGIADLVFKNIYSSRKPIKSSANLYDFTYEDEDEFDRHAFYAVEKDGYFEVTDTDPEYKEVRIGDIITADDAEDMGLEWKEVLTSSRKPIKSGYIIKVTETDNDHTYSPTYVNGDSWQSKEPQIFETKKDAQEQAEDFRKYLDRQRRSMGGRWQYKIEIIESSCKPIKSARLIKANLTATKVDKARRYYQDQANDYYEAEEYKRSDEYDAISQFLWYLKTYLSAKSHKDFEQELSMAEILYDIYTDPGAVIEYLEISNDSSINIPASQPGFLEKLTRDNSLQVDGPFKEIYDDFVSIELPKIKERILKSSRKSIKSGKKSVTRRQIEDELDRVLEKNKISLSNEVYKETVDYILTFWEDDFDDPKDVEEAVHEWYLDTKRNFPDVFTRGRKQRVASSLYLRYIKSSRR